MTTPSGIQCPTASCGALLSPGSVQTQLELQIRSAISKFYESWLVCDDASCGNRTRMVGMLGRRCLKPECRGRMHNEVSRPCPIHSTFMLILCAYPLVLGLEALQPDAVLPEPLRYGEGTPEDNGHTTSRRGGRSGCSEQRHIRCIHAGDRGLHEALWKALCLAIECLLVHACWSASWTASSCTWLTMLRAREAKPLILQMLR